VLFSSPYRYSVSLSLSQSYHLTVSPHPSVRQHHYPPVNTTVHPSTPLSTRQHHCPPVNGTVTPAPNTHARRLHWSSAIVCRRAHSCTRAQSSLSLSMVRPLVRHIVTLPSPEPVGAPRVRPPAGRTRECSCSGGSRAHAGQRPARPDANQINKCLTIGMSLSLVAVNSSQIKASGGGGRAGDPGRARG